MFGQIQGGAGINIGYKNTGIELQGFIINRFKILASLNINKYDSFSMKAGGGVSVFKLKNKHNIWFNSSYEYKFTNTTVLEKNDIFYKYKSNNLKYLNIGGGYSFRINNGEKRNFILLDVELFYKYLINKLNVTPLPENSKISNKYESEINKHFRSGIGFSIGIKFIW